MVIEQSNLGYINRVMDEFESYFDKAYKTGEIKKVAIQDMSQFVVFVSVGNPSIRAKVIKSVSDNYRKMCNQLRQRLVKMIKKDHVNPEWIKFDIVDEVTALSFEQLEAIAAKTRKNYFRKGIAFDDNFNIAFLEQEINGNAMIKNKRGENPQLDETNMNHYLKYNGEVIFPFMKQRYHGKQVYTFETKAMFKERDETTYHSLYSGELTNGIRQTADIARETEALIRKSTYFLTDQVKETGQFEYGYFSAYAKRINTYNILRHSSSLYAMCEGYEIIQDEKIIKAVEKGIDYLIKEAIVYKETTSEKAAFVVDHANEQEIKLGSNATAILAMAKYTEVTGDDKYIAIAQDLARGIIEMKLPDEGFIHVLSYPNFSIKALNRIIYYEGEAIFALLRLYAVDKEDRWLEEVKKTFDYFIANDYWKHHDHWLSYAANELTLYAPEDKYFIFGLKNANNRLNFIYHRETTFPTFLELTMAAYKMVDKIKTSGKEYLLEHIDEAFLEETIDHRAEYQRVGFFYPELAMYKKQPGLILNGFFIRHHSFRVRIDDVEHYLSGYCQYYHNRVPVLSQARPMILEV